MQTERLNPDAQVLHARPARPGIPGDAAESRFTSEDVAEEAVLEPPTKMPVLNTLYAGAHGWRQRRRLHSRCFCR